MARRSETRYILKLGRIRFAARSNVDVRAIKLGRVTPE